MKDVFHVSLTPFFDKGTQKYGAELVISGLQSQEHVDLVLQMIQNAFAILDPSHPEYMAH
jgi:hypothetical protein